MVFLTLSRDGFEALRPRIDRERDAVWVNAGVLSDAEVAELRRAGMNLTVLGRYRSPRNDGRACPRG